MYRDLPGLGEASVRLDVCDVYRSIVAARESTASNTDAKRLRTVLHSNHIRSLVKLYCPHNCVDITLFSILSAEIVKQYNNEKWH